MTVVASANSPPKVLKPPDDLSYAYNVGLKEIDVGQYFEDPEGDTLKIIAVYTICENTD